MNLEVFDWVAGHLSTTERIWSALAPALLLLGYLAVTLPIYTVRFFLWGAYKDGEIEHRGSSVLAGMWVRLYFAWAIRPLWWLVLKSNVPASAVTALSILMAMAGGVALAVGRFALGGWLYIAAGICDFFDGRLARLRKQSSPGGAVLDSVFDRYSDAAILIGLAWFYRDGWVLLVVLVALAGSLMVPYVRAKGESLGIQVKVGVMQRAERITYLGIGVALSPIIEAILAPEDPHPIHRLAVASIFLLAISTQLTTVRRLIYVIQSLDASPMRGWLGLSKGSLFRNILAACTATTIDFALVMLLTDGYQVAPWLATALGCLLGAIANFTINRIWAFGAIDSHLVQISRYSMVSTISALLNSGGVAVLLLLPSLDYRIAWALVRCAVFLAWNFPMHRDYVFSRRKLS